MNNVVAILASLFLVRSSSFFLVTRPTIKSWMGWKFNRIRLWTMELAALERLEESP